ncbi:MAG: TlpA family protein disulfide reductase, partial [Niabella sp.]
SVAWFSINGYGQLITVNKKKLNEQVILLKSINDENQLNKRILELEEGKTEEDLLILQSYFKMNNNDDEADKIAAIAFDKYPDGYIAFSKASLDLYQCPDAKEKEKMYVNIQKRFANRNLGGVAFELATTYAEEGNTNKMHEYNQILETQFGWKSVSLDLINILAKTNKRDAARLLKPKVDSLRKIMELPDTLLSENQMQQIRRKYYSTTIKYGQLLLATKKRKRAHKLAKELRSQDWDFGLAGKHFFASSLLANRQWKDALPLVEELILNNNSTPEITSKLRRAYVGAGSKPIGFADYEQKLLEKADQKIIDESLSKAIDQPSIDFILNDVNGTPVKLSELRGKVVVLDFWATWCGPCKASFPTMQKAVTKYKDDDKVIFYFIHTLDKTDESATKEAKDYIDGKHYTFNVLMDLRDKQSHKSPVADAYGIRGIPTKIIIDPKGNIRFNIVGFYGKEDVAVKELSAMIEFARSFKLEELFLSTCICFLFIKRNTKKSGAILRIFFALLNVETYTAL